MKEERPEFFKLEDSDRKVLAWLKNHVHPNSVRSWMEYIAIDYQRRNGVIIDVDKLYKETMGD